MLSRKVFWTQTSLHAAKSRTNTSDKVHHGTSVRNREASHIPAAIRLENISHNAEREITYQDKRQWTTTQLLGKGQNHFLNINFRVDFVKPFIFTRLEMASFGLFHKGNFKTLRNGWVFCQIMVFVQML